MTEGIVIERKTGVEHPPVGVKGPGSSNALKDQGNAPSTDTGAEPQNAPGVTEKGTQARTETSKDVKQSQKDSGLPTNGSTTLNSSASSTNTTKPAQRRPSLSREVSPATMPDGSHAQTSGDRGESYTPSTMSKFKNKLHIGGGK